MLINLQVGKTRVDGRVDYLLYGVDGSRDLDAVHILDGDPELFKEIARHNPYKIKTYNYLISFEESKEELERKLKSHGKTIEDLYHEVISFLLPAEYYPRESLNILAVAHSDTDNFHIHLTIENYDHQRGRALYIPKNRTEMEFYRALERYFKVKYGLSFGKLSVVNKGGVGKEKLKEFLLRRGTYREKNRDEVKEELTNLLVELIRSGEIETREDIVAYLQSIDGVRINRVGKSYISIKIDGEKKSLRLKGGIYDERQFNELKQHLRATEREISTPERTGELLETVKRKRECFIAKRRERTKSDLGWLESLDKGRSREFCIVNTERIGRPKEDSVDRCFPFTLQSATRTVAGPPLVTTENPGAFFFSLQAEGSNRQKRFEVEGVCSPERSSVSRPEREFRRLSGSVGSYTAMKLKRLMRMRKDIGEIRKLELEYLKNLDPEEILSALGITGWKKGNGYLLMRSPLREDRNPSFEVFFGTERGCWVYLDFATGWSGTSIDLWMEVRGVDYVTAVREMREEFGINLLEEHSENLEELKQKIVEKIRVERERQAEKRRQMSRSEGEELKKVSHRVLRVVKPKQPKLLEYLRERGIEEIPDWLKEIHYLYLPKKKFYYALAVRDENGVWHARSAFGRGKINVLTSPDQEPTYTLVRRGSENMAVVVVEGLFDALTLNQMWKKDYDIVILNSTVNTEKLINSGILQRYRRVVLALDGDEQGREAERKLYEYLKEFEDIRVERVSCLVGKDLNECYLKGGGVKVEDITPQRFYMGTVLEGTEGGEVFRRAVISDRRDVLRRLEASDIERIEDAGNIVEYWRKQKCRGYVELYLSGDIQNLPQWIYQGLDRAVWTELYKPPGATKEWTYEYRPTEIHLRRYFDIGNDVVLDVEIEKNPYKYAKSTSKEVREFARRKIAEIERQRRLEEELYYEQARREKEIDFNAPGM